MRGSIDFLTKLKVKVLWMAFVGYRRLPGWSGYLPFYVFRCPIHGYVENYPMGYKGSLECPLCSGVSVEFFDTVGQPVLVEPPTLH